MNRKTLKLAKLTARKPGKMTPCPRNTDQDQRTAVMSLPVAQKPNTFQLPHYVMPLRGQCQFSEKRGTEGITCLRLGHRLLVVLNTQRRQWKMQFVSSTRVKHTHITDKFVRTMSRHIKTMFELCV